MKIATRNNSNTKHVYLNIITFSFTSLSAKSLGMNTFGDGKCRVTSGAPSNHCCKM